MQKILNYQNKLQSHTVKYDKMKEAYETLQKYIRKRKGSDGTKSIRRTKKEQHEITEAKTHLQHANQLLEKKTEKLYEENLKLKLELEALRSGNQMQIQGNKVTTKFERLRI